MLFTSHHREAVPGFRAVPVDFLAEPAEVRVRASWEGDLAPRPVPRLGFRLAPVPPNPLQPLQKLLISLCDGAGLLEAFAMQWLGREYRFTGFDFAGIAAWRVAEALERDGCVRGPVFWNALVGTYPQSEAEIRAVESHFRPPPTYVSKDHQSPQESPRARRVFSSEEIVGGLYRINLNGAPAAFRRAFESPSVERSRSLDKISRVVNRAGEAGRLVDSMGRAAKLLERPQSEASKIFESSVMAQAAQFLVRP